MSVEEIVVHRSVRGNAPLKMRKGCDGGKWYFGEGKRAKERDLFVMKENKIKYMHAGELASQTTGGGVWIL